MEIVARKDCGDEWRPIVPRIPKNGLDTRTTYLRKEVIQSKSGLAVLNFKIAQKLDKYVGLFVTDSYGSESHLSTRLSTDLGTIHCAHASEIVAYAAHPLTRARSSEANCPSVKERRPTRARNQFWALSQLRVRRESAGRPTWRQGWFKAASLFLLDQACETRMAGDLLVAQSALHLY